MHLTFLLGVMSRQFLPKQQKKRTEVRGHLVVFFVCSTHFCLCWAQGWQHVAVQGDLKWQQNCYKTSLSLGREILSSSPGCVQALLGIVTYFGTNSLR